MRRLALSTLIAVALTLAACGDPSEPKPDPIEPLVGPVSLAFTPATISDTIEAQVGTVTVTVTDSHGRPVPDTTLLFSGTGARVAVSGILFSSATVRTDANGKANVAIRLDTVAGSSFLRAALSGGGTETDSVPVSVLPGKITSFALAPRDTVVYVNNSYALRAAQLDRRKNVVGGTPTLTARTPGTASLTASLVNGVTLGRAVISGEISGLKDSVFVGVVPSGTLVAFAPQSPGTQRDLRLLHVVNLDGSGHSTIATSANGGALSRALGLNAAGDKAIYHDEAGNPLLHIFTIGLNGSGLQQLSTSVGGSDQEAQPEATRDGAFIYFTAAANVNLSVWRASPTFANPTRITPVGQKAYSPTVSPTGDRVAYLSGPIGAPVDALHVRNLASGVVDTVASGPQTPEMPRWSPVGNDIGFIAGNQLWVYDAGTKVMTVLDTHNTYHFGGTVEWSPDGAWVLACASTSAGLVLIRRAPPLLVIPLKWSATWGLCEAGWKP
jgi:hypothetical protein